MKLLEYPDSTAMAVALAAQIAQELTQALKTKERVTLAVPGGTTPGPMFDLLNRYDLAWGRVNVVLTDERWVPETSKRSNTRLLRDRLLINNAAAATYIALYATADTPESKLSELENGLKPALPIDVLVLGMGDDMHTASLFPEADKLAAAFGVDAPLILPMRAPGADEPRITLTRPVLAGALNTHFIIIGEGKRVALQKAIKINDPMRAPVSAFLDGATVHWAVKK